MNRDILQQTGKEAPANKRNMQQAEADNLEMGATGAVDLPMDLNGSLDVDDTSATGHKQ